MPKQTQTYPRALVDLLQVKDGTPFNVEDNYRPTLECIDILGTDRATEFFVSTATVTDGSTFFGQVMNVPDGEIWVLVAASAELVAEDPDDVVGAAVQHQRADRNGPILASDKVTATQAFERVFASVVYPRPTILVPGDAVVGRFSYAAAAGGGPVTGTVRCEHYRFGPGSLGAAL